jgi:phospholipid-translocating ATPase
MQEGYFDSRFAKSEIQTNNSCETIEFRESTPLMCDKSIYEVSIGDNIKHRNIWNSWYKWIKGVFISKSLSVRSIKINEFKSDKYEYPPNIVKNQKYNLVSFLPQVLFEQFSRFFNLYFLIVCISQLFPGFVIGYLFTYIFPLGFVLMISISKEATDDIRRYLRDKEANSQLYHVLTPDGLVDIPSYNLRVGDVLYIEKDQKIPADLVLLKALDRSGSAFIRTDQLDGETDWKLRVSVPGTQKIENPNYLLHLGVSLLVETPHKDIHSFVGKIIFESGDMIEPLCIDNTLWMNSVLASGPVYAVVIYTGKHTRAAMNTNHPSTKFGIIDEELNFAAKLLFLLSFILSFIMISLKGFFGPWIEYLIRFFILFSSIIPMSLRVNVDTARIIYGYQISQDQKIPGIIVRNSSIPEELARVGYILSDKTGTLTRNEMELKKLHLGTISYGSDASDEVTMHLQIVNKTKKEPCDGNPFLTRGRRDISYRVYDIILALALCHNVTPVLENGKISYQAASPDEVAIVRWTQHVGIELIYRDRESIHLKKCNGEVMVFRIIEMFPFSSSSKRMGIIVKDQATGERVFYLKGADTVMNHLVQKNDWLEEECDNTAREGLRTLVFARKRLSQDQLNEFLGLYNKVKLSMVDRNIKMQNLVSNRLEFDLELLGMTGVEDKLQDNVRITLETLKNAGIKIWMLTGDKVETATCIALSSRLISRNQKKHFIQKLESRNDALVALSNLRGKLDHSLIIDGISLELIMQNFETTFAKISSLLPTVVCCRCTPQQKADVTKLLKSFTKERICCIGDGGNDVSMIQAADIGVGIIGKEGKQASLAADFSITQFSHLTRLLLWHGRNSYKRTSKLSQFVIHRGIVITIMQVVFSAIFYFSPIPLYQGVLAMGYCTIFTTFPVFSLVLDQDIKENIALLYPELYRELKKGRALSCRTFFSWTLVSTYQGGVIMLMAIWLFETDFFHIVSITFTSLILNELLMVALHINTWHYMMILAELASIMIYTLTVYFLRRDLDISPSLSFFGKVGVITIVSFVPLFLVKILRHLINPPNYTKLS